MKCQPFAHVVSSSLLTKVCDYCLKYEPCDENSLQICTKCHMVCYCSSQCQQEAWNSYHAKECPYLTLFKPTILPDVLRIIGRTILKLNANGKEEFVKLPNGQKRSYEDLKSHGKEIGKDVRLMEAFDTLYRSLQFCMKDGLPSREIVQSIYAKTLINQIDIYTHTGTRLGVGLYLDASVLDHACAPNAVTIFRGKEMIVRAIEDVDDFNDLSISYIPNLSVSTKKRRQDLLNEYYFHCECSKCQDVDSDIKKSSIICPDCSHCAPTSTGKCSDCQVKLSKLY